VPANQRFFEDYAAGQVYEFGPISISEQQIIDFARQFDPQDFHIDPAKAVTGPYRGIIASGWHTISLAMRLYVDHYLSRVASLGSPGVDEVRWPHPVRPGDLLKIRVAIMEARRSRSKPDRGIVRAHVEAINQQDKVVLTMTVVSLLGCRQ
jgi:acyl dehydratase